MQKSQAVQKGSVNTSTRMLLIICCLLVLLAGCAGLSSQSTPSAPASPSTAGRHVPAKSDVQGNATEELARKQLAKVQQIMKGMSLDQKLGQLILVEYIGKTYQETGLQEMITQQYVGGFIYQDSNGNFDPPYNQIVNVSALSAQAQKDAQVPLLIATDQEGGLVNRLYQFHGPLPSAAEMAATGDPQMAGQEATKAALWMRELGINTDLAPVVDVHTVDPPVLASRMFGKDPTTVVKYAGAYLDGLQKNNVVGTLKHFPGLGAITSDPHTSLPTVNRTLEELRKIDLAPYKLMIQKNKPAMIMATDVLMPAIDDQLPAELSPKAVDGLLRKELGSGGVVISDGLYMKGISARWNLADASTLAIIAGNDLIEGPFAPAQVANVIAGFKGAIQAGRLTEQRIDQSVQRILLMKVQYGIIK